jgi:hypothetical protein
VIKNSAYILLTGVLSTWATSTTTVVLLSDKVACLAGHDANKLERAATTATCQKPLILIVKMLPVSKHDGFVNN